jgi:2-methylisocitrate lyase-like PEP mutase family enzyme
VGRGDRTGGRGGRLPRRRDDERRRRRRARYHATAYVDAGADCVFPIALWEADVVRAFVSEATGPALTS